MKECECFKKFVPCFQWFTYADENGKDVYLMPHVHDETKTRVNNCPCCGNYVRDIQYTKEEFNKYNDI